MRYAVAATSLFTLLLSACSGSDPAVDTGALDSSVSDVPDSSGGDAGVGGDGGIQDSGPMDSGGPVVCDPTIDEQACGGDLIGSWSIVDSCSTGEVTRENLENVCALESFEVLETQATGSLSFSRTGTTTRFDRDFEYTIRYQVRFPETCVGNCENLENVLNQGESVADCSTVGTSCDCDITAAPGVYRDSGDVEIAGAASWVLTSSTGDMTQDVNFCVLGGSSMLRHVDVFGEIVFSLTFE